MFYLSWQTQLEVLSDKELRRFINNLIAWHEGKEVDLKSKADSLIWNGVLPALKVNDDKWQTSADRSRENGKLGGRPPKETTQKTQRVILKPDNSKLLNGNSKEVIDNSEMLKENRK